MYDQVNKYTAKYLTDHGWTNQFQEIVQIYFFERDMLSNCVKHELVVAGDFFTTGNESFRQIEIKTGNN